MSVGGHGKVLAALYPGKRPGKWVGSRAGVYGCGAEKISYAHGGGGGVTPSRPS